MMFLVLSYLICSVFLFIFSHYVSGAGHRISGQMKWHDGFMGLVFLAMATSLPEFLTSISTVPHAFHISKINLGYSNAIGSLIINLMILGVLDIAVTRGSMLNRGSGSHILTGRFTMMLLVILVLFAFLRQGGVIDLTVFNIGIESFVILILYLCGMRLLYKTRHLTESQEDRRHPDTLFRDWMLFAFLLLGIFSLSIWLASIGNSISLSTRINQNFVGSVFLAFSTSLPELAVSLAALRKGFIGMALGNILGSNFFDVCIIPGMDIVYRDAPILQSISKVNIFATILSFTLTAIIVWGLYVGMGRVKKRVYWATSATVVLGLLGYIVVYWFG